jgi:hypothetical protein
MMGIEPRASQVLSTIELHPQPLNAIFLHVGNNQHQPNTSLLCNVLWCVMNGGNCSGS